MEDIPSRLRLKHETIVAPSLQSRAPPMSAKRGQSRSSFLGRPLETNLLRLWLRPIYFLASFFLFPSSTSPLLAFPPAFFFTYTFEPTTNKYREEKQKWRHSMTLLSPYFFHPPSIPICLCRCCRCESHAIDKQQSSHPPNPGKKKKRRWHENFNVFSRGRHGIL